MSVPIVGHNVFAAVGAVSERRHGLGPAAGVPDPHCTVPRPGHDLTVVRLHARHHFGVTR